MRRTVLAVLVLLAVPLAGLPAGAPPAAAANCTVLTDFTYVEDQGLVCQVSQRLWAVYIGPNSVGLTVSPDEVVHTHLADRRNCCFESLPNEYRKPDCVGNSSYRIRAIYAYPKNKSFQEGTRGEIRTAIRRMNAFLHKEAVEAGISFSDLRVACNDGQVSVAAIHLSQTAGNATFSSIVRELQDAGYKRPKVKYLVYYDGAKDGVCGQGTLYYDESDSAANRSNSGPGYGINYKCMDSDLGSNGWGAAVFMHELFHTFGAVQPGSPNSTGGHCTDERDVMCYDDDAPGGVRIECPNLELDCHMNDYWAPTKTNTGEGWIGSHWNIGACYFRFIERSGCGETASRPAPPTNLDATGTIGGGPNRLTWTGSATATRYYVYRSSGTSPSSQGEKDMIGSTTATSFSDSSTRIPGLTYCYEVTAVNGAGESGASNEDCVLEL